MMVDNAGHFPNYEQPDVVNAELLGFFKARDPGVECRVKTP